MIYPGTVTLAIIGWIARLLRLAPDPSGMQLLGPLDESEITEQLDYGRD